MVELGPLQLIDPSEQGIVLQTKTRKLVKNAIDPPPRYDQIQKYERLLAKHKTWEERVPPRGGYNCVGLVWACRRTGVFEESQIQLIFHEDGFRKLQNGEPPQVGDVVTYWSTAKPPPRYFLHMGLVLDLKEAYGLRSKIPWVLSKLDATSGEVLHFVSDITFTAFDSIEQEFWTDRPA